MESLSLTDARRPLTLLITYLSAKLAHLLRCTHPARFGSAYWLLHIGKAHGQSSHGSVLTWAHSIRLPCTLLTGKSLTGTLSTGTLVLSILLLGACATNPEKPATTTQSHSITDNTSAARQALLDGDTSRAMPYLNAAIDRCDINHAQTADRIYASRGKDESLYYLVLAANEGISATVENTDCSTAVYLRGYAHIELQNWDNAKLDLTKSITLAPANAHYLAELGHYYQVKQQWPEALTQFQRAEKFAKAFSPEDVKISELTRAKRGIGFVLIEQGQLNQAEAKFKESLALDPNDRTAQSELRYINKLREKDRATDQPV